MNDGVFGFMRIEPGEHLLGAVGPGVAPVALRFVHDGGTITLGAAGRLTVVANEDASWIRVDVSDVPSSGPSNAVRVRSDNVPSPPFIS